MATSGDLSFFFPDAELVFALTCAAGTNYRRVAMFLGNQLKQFGYESVQIRLSEIIRKWSAPAPNAIPADEYGRILWHMEQGNELRRRTDRRDFVALAAMSEINAARETQDGVRTVRPHTAHILSTLKRPEEVEILRRVYGPGLFLIGVFETQPERLAFLHDEYGMNEADAQRLFEKDEEDTDPFGQQTRETFHLADVFVRIQGSDYQVQISRLLDLIFRRPFHTPSPDEQAMFFAQAAAMRSAQLGRQVGAAIVSRSGDLLAVGCNDVPRAGGGLYWPGDGDKRDHVLECDANDVEKEKIARDIVKRLKPVLRKRDRGRAELRLRDSRLFDITEFGRAVHAEMDAILCCARAGSSSQDATLYSTTFPCHNCTRHMIAAGIRRVVYIEPYPKSKAKQLHADAIRIEGTAEAASSGRRVPFEPFLGISPRRYAELFCAKGPGFNIQRKDDGRAAEWRRGQFGPRIPLQPIGYLQREQLAAEELSRLDKIAYVGETHGNEERPQRPRLNARVPRRKR